MFLHLTLCAICGTRNSIWPVSIGPEKNLMRIIPSIRWVLIVVAVVCLSIASFAQVGIVVTFAPPALPVYEQPPCPDAGYLWTPGYWAYDNDYGDYYWVPGTWVMAPQVGYLWTPPYWGWGGSGYAFYPGYWGPQVGWYGGIAYGFGYYGNGYEGGRWNNGQFYYNRSVNNVNITNIHNVYNTTVNENNNRVSYNGGQGGINARPTAAQESAMHERHIPPVAAQNQQVEAARGNQQLRASVNQGRPPIAATAKAGAFSGGGVVPAKAAGAPYHPPANRAAGNAAASHPANEAARPATPANEARPANEAARPTNEAARPAAPASAARPATPVHAKELPPHPALPPPNTGNAKTDQKYQKQQQQLAAQQEADHAKLAQSQEQEHQRLAQQQASAAKTQQVEQKHQQQTQQMEQKHVQQQQTMQARQQPPASHAAPPASHAEEKPAK
jgi:hypothetical protein